MVKFKVRQAAKAVGVRNANQLRAITGLSVAACYALWKEEIKGIEFHTLNALCKALNCQPGDLLVRTPKNGQ